MMKITLIVLCLIWSLCAYTAGEYLSKRWANNPSLLLALCVTGAYALSQFGWLPALRMHGQLSALTVIWAIAAIACGVAVGVFAFNEQISNTQIVGIVLAIISMVLMF